MTPLRLAMWSGPRNISTAMMRAWENRGDCAVVDEPLYAHYLANTGLDHPGREESSHLRLPGGFDAASRAARLAIARYAGRAHPSGSRAAVGATRRIAPTLPLVQRFPEAEHADAEQHRAEQSHRDHLRP